MSFWSRSIGGLGIAVAVAALMLVSPGAVATPGPTSSPGEPADPVDARVTGWTSDIDALVPGMDALHPDLTHGTSRAELDAAAAELRAQVPTASDDRLMVGLLRIVALVSEAGCDAHTGAYVWGSGTYPVHSLPLRLWWFDDGVRIVDALEPYRDLVGSRIDAVDAHPTAEVLAALDPLIPRDNEQTVRLLMPRYLLTPELLHGLGLVTDVAKVALTISDDASGSAAGTDVMVDAIAMAEYNDWATPYGLHIPVDPQVPYLSRIGDALWWQTLPDGTLFIQANRVERSLGLAVDPLREAFAEAGSARVVLDLRHNYGGEVAAVDPFVTLFVDAAAARPGGLFVLTGRNTFSAANLMVARLIARTHATVVGEPMGGCPTAYGNSSDMTLPYSGISVSVARLLEVGVALDDARETIEPDIPAPLTYRVWASKVDPALAAIGVSDR